MHIANSDKPVALYSLDVILAVGYRANSKLPLSFDGGQLTRSALISLKDIPLIVVESVRTTSHFLTAVEQIKALLPSGERCSTKSVLVS